MSTLQGRYGKKGIEKMRCTTQIISFSERQNRCVENISRGTYRIRCGGDMYNGDMYSEHQCEHASQGI